MSSSDSTWRDHPFVDGKTYAAQKSFVGLMGNEFVSGRLYVFDRVAYSHYDSCTVITFHEYDATAPVQWWWHDDEPEALCSMRFKEVK
jgi:hypothetical protein